MNRTIHHEFILSLTFCFVFCLIPFLNSAQTTFKEVIKEFPRQDKNLRKWDAPVIADLDQDGYLDILINDHGFGVQVQWNNNGKYTKPYDIIMGDLHGVSVGDIDKDDNLEVIMSRGGGSGSNARNSKLYRVTKDRKFIELGEFNEPLAMMRGRTVSFIDGDNDGDLDLLNFAFPDGQKKGASENYIYENDGNGQLTLHGTIPAAKGNGQKTLITDFNGDDILDFILYGHGPIKAYKGNGDLTYSDVSKKVFPNDIEHVSGITEIDYDNDGDFDLYITRGSEFNKGDVFYDKDTKTLGFFTKRGELELEDLEIGDILNLENFQSQWPNNNTYYIGETSYDYEFKGETHSGKDIKLVNSDALGYPDKVNYKNKKGWYIGYVGNKKWRIAGFLWAPATGIIHGVEGYSEVKHSEGLQDILLENKGNKFKDITKEFGLSKKEHNMAASVADFDNNGFQDLLVIRRGDLIHFNESILYLNKGESGFETLQNHNIVSTELGAIGMAIETVDYNQDGKVDIVIGNERGKWHLFKNESVHKSHNYLIVEIGNSKSGTSALGAKVETKFCKNNQVQRVGSTGAQYSLSHNTFVHFGLKNCSSVEVKVTWTNGETETKTVSTINKKIKIGH